MADIYQHAQSVVVWLGPNDSPTDRGIGIMQHLAAVSEHKHDTSLPSDLQDKEGLKRLGIPKIAPRGWLVLGKFLMRTWFRRIWVLQETFAATNPVVFCGTHFIEWSEMTAESRTLGSTRLARLLLKEMEIAEGNGCATTKYLANTISNQIIFGDIIKANAQFLNLETLLAYSRYFGAKKDQDRVYAVRGMWKRFPVHDTEAFISLKSDYRLSVHNVYTTASIATILEMRDLEILSLVEDFSFRSMEMKDLPSWVPEYSVTPVTEPLAGNPRPVEGIQRWNASKRLAWQLPPLLDLLPLPLSNPKPVLLVTGIRFVDVLEIASSILDSPTTSYDDGCVDASWRTLIKDTCCEQPANEKCGESRALLPTMWVWEMEMALGLHGFEEDVEELGYRPSEDSYYQTQKLTNEISVRDKRNQEYKGDLPEYLAADYEQISKSFRSAYLARRLFRTTNNYIGIGPQSLQKDDQVWVLAGASVSIVLRPLLNVNWYHVGEAYVHGIMKGEVVKFRRIEMITVGLE